MWKLRYLHLQQNIKNRGRYQEKRKDREDNRVCRKNEEGLERDKGSIKKDVG